MLLSMISMKKCLSLKFCAHFLIQLSILSIRWLRKQPLPIARCHGQLITHSSSFYLIGGYTELKENEDETVDLLDKYEPRQDRWITQTRMQPARHDLCAEIIGMTSLRVILLHNCVYDV